MYKLAAVLSLVAGQAVATGLEIDVQGQANGTVSIDLFEDVAPQHVARIVALANEGSYNGVVFHRVIDGFMAQTGDVEFGKVGGDLSMAGMGGSTLPDLPAEFSDRPFVRGIVGMARAQDPNSANSQFFIMYSEYKNLDNLYTVVGEVTSGMDLVDQIRKWAVENGTNIGNPDVMSGVRVTN